MAARAERATHRITPQMLGACLCAACAAVWLITHVPNFGSGGAAREPTQLIIYTADTTTDFPNPERGFYRSRGDAIAEQPIPNVRSENLTLIRTLFRLDQWIDTRTLPRSFLAEIKSYFAQQRALHQKSIVRFLYAFGTTSPTDATRDITVAHIRQLASVLTENRDVIAWFDAGFIGAWGEWHTSSHPDVGQGTSHISADAYSRRLTSSGTAIYDALMEYLPQDRLVAVRFPAVKEYMYGFDNPLTATSAWSGTARARHAFHDDCFLTNEHDSTTWFASPDATREKRQTIAEVKAFIHADATYTAVAGETCQIDNSDESLTDCSNATATLAYLHFTALNRDFYAPVLDKWVSQGCMPEIQRKLGYRLRVTSAVLPTGVTAGARMAVMLTLANDGYAAIPNRRPVNIVLRSRATGVVARLATGLDPRKWLSGTIVHERVNMLVPANLGSGDYEVLLELPDPLQPAVVQESVRLAMTDTWESSTGFNSLRATLAVKSASTKRGPDG